MATPKIRAPSAFAPLLVSCFFPRDSPLFTTSAPGFRLAGVDAIPEDFLWGRIFPSSTPQKVTEWSTPSLPDLDSWRWPFVHNVVFVPKFHFRFAERFLAPALI